MKRYYFYSKYDSNKEAIGSAFSTGRLGAANRFARIKCLTLKQFLSIYTVAR
jgi:hypothetical protein